MSGQAFSTSVSAGVEAAVVDGSDSLALSVQQVVTSRATLANIGGGEGNTVVDTVGKGNTASIAQIAGGVTELASGGVGITSAVGDSGRLNALIRCTVVVISSDAKQALSSRSVN